MPKQQKKFFFCSGMSKDIQIEMCVQRRIFPSQGRQGSKGPSLVQSKDNIGNKPQNVVSFGSLEQKLELERDGLCV